MTSAVSCRFRVVSLIFVLLTSAWLLVQGAGAAEQPQYGGVLRIVDVAEGGQPIGVPWETSGIDTKLQKPYLESLLREDVNGNYHPWLATAWEVDTAKNAITIKLREGVKFHDGTDFNAKASKWIIDKSIEAKILKGFLSVDVVDDYTIRVNVDQFQNNHLNLLATMRCSPISPTAFEKNGIDWARWHPVGTGPFKFVDYVRGTKLIYTKWEGYWQKGRPYLDGIEYFFIRDQMTQQAALRASGAEKVQVLCVTSGEQAALAKSQGFQIISMPIGPVSLVPDSANADSPLSKKQVREAISLAINREAIVKARGFGYWVAANQIPSPGRTGYVSDLSFGQYDPKRAKQLLAEAGYPNGFKITIHVMPAMVDRDAMVAVQQFLKEVGIEVNLEFPDGGGYITLEWKNGWKNGFMAQHTRMLATANITYNFYWHTSAGHWPSLKRPDGLVDKLDASLRTAAPEDPRMQEMTKMLADDAMFIPLYYVSEMYIVQPNVHDTGYCEWSASTVNTPETTWMSK